MPAHLAAVSLTARFLLSESHGGLGLLNNRQLNQQKAGVKAI